jgi:hypothetical protein
MSLYVTVGLTQSIYVFYVDQRTNRVAITALPFCAFTRRVVAIPFRRFLLGFLILEDGTDRLSRNVRKELPLLAA